MEQIKEKFVLSLETLVERRLKSVARAGIFVLRSRNRPENSRIDYPKKPKVPKKFNNRNRKKTPKIRYGDRLLAN